MVGLGQTHGGSATDPWWVRHWQVRVLLGGRVLATASNVSLRPGVPALASVTVHNRELSVALGGVPLLDHLPLPGWNPTRTWRMALGARSGAEAASVEVRQAPWWVSNVAAASQVPSLQCGRCGSSS